MTTVGVLQARMGSSRLPGKMMYPLACRPVVEHVVRRVQRAETLDELVVAISEHPSDDVLKTTLHDLSVTTFRGSEQDVLARIYDAAVDAGADDIVRICGDTPLLSPAVVDAVVERLWATDADYVYTMEPRTFPRGLDVEAFSARSFEQVADRADQPHQREHVTVYYREHSSEFDLETVTSANVFDDDTLVDRPGLRLTLDEAADYELFRRVYDELDFEGIIALRDAVDYIDSHELASINEHVEQRAATDSG
ncbi:cytidylyltransferase domain-containing protein [Haloplanus aerogenes]|uniref:Acylneuraminate cytidylyltransferase n=1 Tax=Haloplanus aerogenes TaxID=660522 RepID=A0A3M0D8Z8_9EURY|nr:glycosyltransferase family protein [Haloplanus aerogenes]AZH26320.1 acylneuraminate cytidylyltransferase [Haloplanus aerogenes]RMB18221.1 spore coat polysaccharide biosynthesis protein SpsF [Haloplanus aerogenes]